MTFSLISLEKDTTLEQFALLCSAKFREFAELRDLPPGTPAPEAFEPDPYPKNRLKEAEDKLSALMAMGPEEIEAEIRRSLAAWEELRATNRERVRERRECYVSMRKKVRAWMPQTENLRDLKTAMLERLARGEKELRDTEAFCTMPPSSIRAAKIASAAQECRHFRRECKAEEKRVAQINAWLAELRESLHVDTPKA